MGEADPPPSQPAPDALLWSQDKDEWLRRERKVGFDDVRKALLQGGFLADLPHPHVERFPSQRVLVVEIRGETYVVPYVPGEKSRFLKTIYPSRKARRLYGRSQQGAKRDA
jgi:hypothetical protein